MIFKSGIICFDFKEPLAWQVLAVWKEDGDYVGSPLWTPALRGKRAPLPSPNYQNKVS